MKGFNITFIACLIFTSFALSAQTNTFFVTQNGTGNGTSWSDASSDINALLSAAKAGDQIWVAKGTYLTNKDGDKNVAFIIPSDIQVYGGFTGTETNTNQRDVNVNTTILSGELNTDSTEDNSYNVVVFKHASQATLLDGFTITGGTGNGVGTTGDRARCGGGIYNDGAGTGNRSNPTIANCIITNNSSRDGGAVYNNGIAGQANPTFINCQFTANKANLDGGAIFNDGRKEGQSNPLFIDCQIKDNVANYGGGVCNYASAGESSPTFDSCKFVNNIAKVRGGGMFNMDVEGVCEPIIKHCSFTSNDASTGASLDNLIKIQPTAAPIKLAISELEWVN